MGRDKRKSRLDKGGSTGGEFVGFGAFAAPSASLKASPVYSGSSTQLSPVFKKITQKRDAVTKTRALNELQEYFETEHNRKDQVDALSHLVFVYHSKLNYDDASSVRAAAISCLNAARLRLPKAWKTLVAEQQPEVSGMMWCGRSDTAAEVRTAAALYDDASQNGVIQYVTRILGYDRPRAMHDALFARKQETEPPDRDELDERYERIVGCALGGIGLWIHEHPETEGSSYQDPIKDGILWSTLKSSKSSLRRKTYALLSTLSQFATSLVYGDVGLSALPKLLTNSLTQEKDAVNIPSLLEVLLLFLSNFPDDNPWTVVDAPSLVKSLGKQLKKACHGASADHWAPTMLPLLALISDDTFALQLQLLKNMLTGMQAAIGSGDSLLIAAAVAECSSFFLLRREPESSQMDVEEATQFAAYWLQILGQYLSSETIPSMARAADISLLRNLSDSFVKLDESSASRPQSAIYRVQDWFWNKAIESTVLEASGSLADQRWAELLGNVMDKRPKETLGDSRAKPVVRMRFNATLSGYQGESGSAPTVQADDVMLASVRYCGAPYLFENDGDSSSSLDHFLTNDLLRWLVMGTSSLSTRTRRKALVELEFTLLRECLTSVASPLKQQSLWSTILRECIAAKCDLELLGDGLRVLMNDPATLEVIRCEELDKFAVKVGEEATQRYHSHNLKDYFDDGEEESYEKEAKKTLVFLRTCSGLVQANPMPLVSQRVIHQWTKEGAPDSREHVFEVESDDTIQNPVVTTLLSLVSRGDVSLLSPEDVDKVILESWRRGGRQWYEEVVPLLLDQGNATVERQHLCSSEHIIRRGTNELRDILDFFSTSSGDDLAHVALICHVWSERAFRILRLCNQVTALSEESDDRRFVPSLALVGLDAEMWNSSEGESFVSQLYLCLVYLLQQYENQSERLELFLQSSDSPATLMKDILLAISDASSGVVVDPVTRRDHKCAFVLSLLGGRDIPYNLRQSWCREVIEDLSVAMNSSCVRVTRSVSVLSELLFTIFDRIVVDERSSACTADVVDVSEGDDLWYAADENKGKERSKARVVKVHSDDFPRLYFTIQVEQDEGGVQERQTVAERLRKLSRSPCTIGDAVILSHFSDEETTERVKYGDMIFDELVKPMLLPTTEGQETPVVDGASECLNLIICHCGLVGKEGLTSTRYEVFKLLSSMQSSISQSIGSEDNISNSTPSLRVLSLAMGLGGVVPASRNNFKLMKFRPDESVKAILEHYNSGEEVVVAGKNADLDRSVLEWLTVSIGDVDSASIRKDGAALLCRLANITMIQAKGGIMSDTDRLADSVLVMRSIQNAEIAALSSPEDGSPACDNEQNAVISLVKSFSLAWTNASETVCDYEVLDKSMRTSSARSPEWYEPFQSLLKTLLEQQRGMVAIAAKRSCDTLVENLFSTNKRWLAFKLLVASADGEPLRLDFFTGDSTTSRLQTWQESLIEEEAEELEDDIGLVGQWIPEALMNELESWEDSDEFDEGDRVNGMGKMICWLSFLSFVDSAAAVDIRFRGSVSAYLSYVDVDSVLATALSNLNLYGKERNSKQKALITLQEVLAERSSLEFSKVASLVMFRTVQTFPTVFKNWWENDCPKNRSAAVSQFVETVVAPEALRRELERINQASDLGEMTVSGSAVSREVTATYTQDECQLSIAVKIPPNFPLRNVEVDGRLTLGVPEKRWKRWALQIRQMLNNQDGTLLDALMLWKENVDKDFSGLEPCPVCYSILSVKTHELPNLQCNTCNNCFHSSCLYKWFHSSGKSSCVLCQQPWSGTRLQRGS